MPDHDKGRTGTHVCPWWFAYTFDNFLRRLVHPPAVLLGPYLKEGMSVLDIGCGMGHFSIGMARLVGPAGRVLSVDLQAKMLEIARRRAARAGVADRIDFRLCRAGELGLDSAVDFALAFWMVHETPDPEVFFGQVRSVMKEGSLLLVAEPSFHVSAPDFSFIVKSAFRAGLGEAGPATVRFSRAVLLHRR